MPGMDPLVAQFYGFVAELTAPEKRSIVALTEIARDALRTHPHLAASLATVISNRVLEAPTSTKLSVLYLLDSIVKNIGEPYKTYFAPRLPDIFCDTWIAGAPGLHRPLQKLLNTWDDVLPPDVLTAIRARLPHSAAPVAYAPSLSAAPQHAPGGVPATAYPPASHHKPMAVDPRLLKAAQQTRTYAAPYIAPGGAAAAAVPYTQQAAAAQQQFSYPNAGASMQVPDLLSLLSAVTTAQQRGGAAAGATALAEGAQAGKRPKKVALTDNPPTVEFIAQKIKEHNPAAVARLRAATERTKHSFLDRTFLRRQKAETGKQASRLWYVDLDTWMASTTAGGGGGDGQGPSPSVGDTADAAAAPAATSEEVSRRSVPADDEQTHCALSGEKFEQYWDEQLQEWRYMDAVRLDPEQAAAHGLEEGAIVLVSALGSGAIAKATTTMGPKAEAEEVKNEVNKGAAAGEEPEPDEAPEVLGNGEDRAAKRIKLEVA